MTTSDSAATSTTAVGSYVNPGPLRFVADTTGLMVNQLILEIPRFTMIGTLEMLPRKVDQLGGIECSVVGTGLGVYCVLVEVGLVNRKGCSVMSRLRPMYPCYDLLALWIARPSYGLLLVCDIEYDLSARIRCPLQLRLRVDETGSSGRQRAVGAVLLSCGHRVAHLLKRTSEEAASSTEIRMTGRLCVIHSCGICLLFVSSSQPEFETAYVDFESWP
jgi:hypothetical protein